MKSIYYYAAQEENLLKNYSNMSFKQFTSIFPFTKDICIDHWVTVFPSISQSGNYYSYGELIVLVSDIDFGFTVLTENYNSRPTIFRKVGEDEMSPYEGGLDYDVTPLKWHCLFINTMPYEKIKSIFRYFLKKANQETP